MEISRQKSIRTNDKIVHVQRGLEIIRRVSVFIEGYKAGPILTDVILGTTIAYNDLVYWSVSDRYPVVPARSFPEGRD